MTNKETILLTYLSLNTAMAKSKSGLATNVAEYMIVHVYRKRC